ncbi:hypothetical protein [Microlunatus aurantiacus]|uniref:hypothetical protein n=1 Tax=Microlunatus aurantiacus TaxID=446786 RepID=UPI0031D2F17B
MTLLAAVRLVSYLNAAALDPRLRERAPFAVQGTDLAHHVVDPQGLIGVDPWAAAPLPEVFEELLAHPGRPWLLALPGPGRLAPLQGPPELVRAALAAGSAVVATGGGLALVPHRVGPALQWEVLPAERPGAVPTAYEAERELSETVLRAARDLTDLDVAGGRRPKDTVLELAPGYPPRQRLAADRAARLWLASAAALDGDGTSISVYEADRRRAALLSVREAAAQALVAAVSWLGVEQD